MLVKLTAEQIAKLGAKDPADASAKLTAFFAANAQLETAMDNQPDFASIESRIKSLESAAPAITEARVKELIGAEANVPIKAFLSGDEGKKLIGAESSRVTMELMGATGTTPVKPAPAASAPIGGDANSLIAAGKFEEAFPLLPAEARADFADAKSFAAYQKAMNKGAVLIKPSRN